MKKEKEVADQAKEEKTVKGYKGFDKDLKCRNFQYEIGKEFEEQGEPSTCNNGFHYCENPLDVFNYYAPTNGNRFTEVIGKDKFSYHTDDSKVATSKIEIGLEVSMSSLINGAVKFIFSKAKEVTENSSATSGYGANSATSGEGCISAALNANGKAKASLGSFIVLAEYVDDNKGYELWKPIDVKAFKVDGKKIKADTYYKLVDGKAKETE